MNDEPRPPTLTQQIDAVQWAWAHAREIAQRWKLRPAETEEIVRRLDAAIETLRMLERGGR